MKHFIPGVAVVLALVLVASVGSGQVLTRQNVPNQIELFLGGGLSAPVSPAPFADYWETGFNVHGGFSYFVLPFLAAGVQAEWSRFAANPDPYTASLGLIKRNTDVTGNLSVLVIAFKARVFLAEGSHVKPYLTAGAGWAKTSGDSIKIVSFTGATPPPEYRAGVPKVSGLVIPFGVGVAVDVSRQSNVFLEVNANIVQKKGSVLRYAPLRIGFGYIF